MGGFFFFGVAAGRLASRSRRWTVLTVGPLIGAAVAWWIAEPVGRGGNLLSALVYMASALLLGVYHLGLAVFWIVERSSGSGP